MVSAKCFIAYSSAVAVLLAGTAVEVSRVVNCFIVVPGGCSRGASFSPRIDCCVAAVRFESTGVAAAGHESCLGGIRCCVGVAVVSVQNMLPAVASEVSLKLPRRRGVP